MVTRNASVNLLGITRLRRRINHLQNNIFSKTLMGEIGEHIKFAIKKRTMEGVDVNDTKFTPYSPGYAIFRVKKGRSTKVNLFFTGSMFSSMDYEVSSSKVKTYFLNTEDEHGSNNPKKAFFLNQDRNFFALSESDINKIVNITENHYRRILNV